MSTMTALPETARLWVYQSPKTLSDKELHYIRHELQNFLSSWDSHGNPLKGYGEIRYGRFVVIAVDQEYNVPSGCSIDKSVSLMQGIGKELGVDFLDKSNVCYLDENEQVQSVDFRSLKTAVSEDKITSDTLVFDNSITNYGQYESGWPKRAADTWLKRYF